VSWLVIVPTVALTAGIFLFALTAGVRALSRRPQLGAEALVGATGTAYGALTPDGQIKLKGEIWRAVADRPTPEGATVRVVGVDGLTLRVVGTDGSDGGTR
jgi:membrane-bound serine protease (ClpP class)